VALPISLLLLAIGSAAWLAYGMNPNVAAEFGGLALVTLTRKLQWILLIATIVPSLVLIVRVSIGRNREWWLIGLSLVLALLFVRFSPANRYPVRIVDGPEMPTLREVGLESDSDFVVGLEFDGTAYAFPYRSLLRTPIVQLTNLDRRLILIHSPYANLATALEVEREVRAWDLECVAFPGNSTLVYNKKYGQFIVGVTGLTDHGARPTGVRERVDVYRMTLAEWRRLHPDSRLMLPTSEEATSPGVPVAPRYPMKLADTSMPPDTQVTLIRTDPPGAILYPATDMPVPVKCGDAPLILWRDGGLLRAFHRVVDRDLYLSFAIRHDRAGKQSLIDEQTQSTWNRDGSCIDGKLKGKRLAPVPVEESTYWGVCKTWWPDLTLTRPEPPPATITPAPITPAPVRPASPRRR
jgi:hypothetical protein